MAGAASPFGHEKSELIKQLEAAADERIAPNAKDVDKNSRFPQEALDVMQELKILSSSLPTELGGLGLKLPELSEIASTLGRRCGASAMVFAMHESQIESMRFGSVGDAHVEAILRDYAENQKLVASVTSEAGIGGNIRASQTVAEAGADRVVFEKQSPTLSYAEYADGFLITARRSEDAAQSDQVLVYASKEETELEKLGVWDMMGMRGTCSPPFKVSVDVPAGEPDRRSVRTDQHAPHGSVVAHPLGVDAGRASPPAPSTRPRTPRARRPRSRWPPASRSATRASPMRTPRCRRCAH